MEKIINQLIENQIENEKSNYCHNTYLGEGGLKYCTTCNEPVQSRRENIITGNTFLVARNCLCARNRIAENERIMKARKEEQAFKDRQKDCFGKFLSLYNCTFESSSCDSETFDYAKRLANDFDKYKDTSAGVLFWGKFRTSKTYMACAVANHIMKQGYTAKLIKLSDTIKDVFKEIDKNSFLDRLQEYNLLIIDDLGVEKKTEYNLEIIYKIIDDRLTHKKPMIITTNLTLDEIKHPESRELARIYCRIEENYIPILFEENLNVDKGYNKRLIAEILQGGKYER